jgi:hypothetical protein
MLSSGTVTLERRKLQRPVTSIFRLIIVPLVTVMAPRKKSESNDND